MLLKICNIENLSYKNISVIEYMIYKKIIVTKIPAYIIEFFYKILAFYVCCTDILLI